MITVPGKGLHHTLGSYPGLTHAAALQRAVDDRHIADVSCVQICPQNHGAIDDAIESLQRAVPETAFRLHANVRLSAHRKTYDASAIGAEADSYFKAMSKVSARLGATVYTLHAGERVDRPLESLKSRILWLTDIFGHRVGVEGHYPVAGNKWWLSSWAEYRWLLDSGLDYALDLSHLNIVAVRSRSIDHGLVRELLANERCVEVHLSANDGFRDLHLPLSENPNIWWAAHLDQIHRQANCFYEGNEVRAERTRARSIKFSRDAKRHRLQRIVRLRSLE